MATTATHGFGCTLKYDDAADMAGAITVGQVESIGDLSLVADDIEVTNHGSTTSYNSKATKEYICGNIEAGEVAVTLIYEEVNAAVYDGLLGGTSGSAYWQILLPDNSHWKFHGYVKSIGMSGMTTNDALRFNMTIKIDGAYTGALPTFTQA